MARTETLTAYKCSFIYVKRNNPLKEELNEQIKTETPPDYAWDNFVNDFREFTAPLVVGKITERAILLPSENIYQRECDDDLNKWRIVPYAGKQGKPFHIIKTSTGQKYDFASDSAALYEHNIFLYQSPESAIAIFHRQSGSGCKSVFLEVANKMLREKGIKLEMELYLPLVSAGVNVQATKLQLQYVRSIETSDIAEKIHNKRKAEVIQELGLNLESQENSFIKHVLHDMKLGKISQDLAFARIKQNFPNSDIYNDAQICIRIGKRHQTISWGEFDSLFGNYDITDSLHSKFKLTGDFIGSLTELSDEYYNSIITEENVDEI